MQEIISIINSVGFPIGVCLVCFWYINKRETSHEDERAMLTEIVQNNTEALIRIADALNMQQIVQEGENNET